MVHVMWVGHGHDFKPLENLKSSTLSEFNPKETLDLYKVTYHWPQSLTNGQAKISNVQHS